MANENKFGLRAKIAAIFSTIALFVLMYSACNTEKDVNDDTKDSERMIEANEQYEVPNLSPTRVYTFVEITPNLFGKEAEKACKQNDKQFNPKYDKKNDVCHLTIKQPIMQTKKLIRKLLPKCVIGKDDLQLTNIKISPYKKLDGVCSTNREDWYKTDISFKKPISFKQDIVNQCKNMDNCTCDKSNNCTLHVYEEILSIPEPKAYNVIGKDIHYYFNFDDADVLAIRVKQLSNKNEYRVTLPGLPVTIFYHNVKHIEDDQKVYCFQQSRIPEDKISIKHDCRDYKFADNKRKVKPKMTAQEDICLDTYLGAKYKNGKCEFPVYQRMNGRADLEKKFDSCKINKIIPGKNNTATAKAVCKGMPSVIHVKNYKDGKNSR